ncbi:ATP-dependent helicase [Gordonia soli]|uniref:DNA 3'-5' helicase n=1 Tax=Gordonia soli NBRC 108243 TaxID=1223545 RepID=M0QGR2_9ACTN|nr:ATP-dependent DNA helicase [Gordonia soli]GAC66602.1 putative ATP-dependent DNA helicase [Gordonia soli NBRC 108243]
MPSRRDATPAPRAPRQPSGTALRTRLVGAADGPVSDRMWPPEVAVVLDPRRAGHAEDIPEGDHSAWRPYRVHGGPGSGKSALIVDAAVARLTDPAIDPESVLVLASGRDAATRLREEITRRVLSAGGALGGALREPLVRTVHSYAFAVLRLQASVHGNPPPRLVTGSEQDVILRELLAGDIEDGAPQWPSRLRPALGTDGFAQALRDLIMRAAERGVGPEELSTLGRRHKRPEWVAAGHAYAQYEHTMLLRGAVGLDAPTASAPAVDAAELVGSALSAFATDPELLAAQRRRIRHLLVDDAQHLDPQAAELVTLIGTGTDSTVIAADTDQSIYGFRGASPRFADGLAETGSPRDIVLDVDHRGTAAINDIGRMLATRLPGARPHAYPTPAAHVARSDADYPHRSTVGGADVAVFSSPAKEATAIADLLRRAHLFDGVPWSQMAVIVRSVSLALPALRRAFRSAGVPVTTPTSDLPLHRQRAVVALMLVLRVVDARRERAARPVDGDAGDRVPAVDAASPAPDPVSPDAVSPDALSIDEVVTLLSGPIGGADPGAMRRLRRGVRRSDEKADIDADSLTSLRAAILDPDVAHRYLAALTEAEATPLRRVVDVIGAAHRVSSSRRGLEETLWAAWQASGLERRWSASALRGGPAGEQADRDLDAVMAVFEAAAAFADTLPAAGPGQFVHYLTQLQIPRESRTPTARGEAVTILSAHAASGREWEVVTVAGVLDGLWPSLRSRGSVLGTGALVDLLDGMNPDAVDTVARGAVALAEERRLLLVACTRARSRLLVTAVEDGSGDSSPSRFVPEIAEVTARRAGLAPDEIAGPVTDALPDAPLDEVPLHPGVDRVLSLPSLVASLRAAVVAGVGPDADGVPDADSMPDVDERAIAAAGLLAELADSDIPGAHPSHWFGLGGPSTDSPLWTPDRGPVSLSPSNVEALTRCSLRWVLERHGGRDGDGAPALTGTLVHTLVQAVAGTLDHAEVTAALREIWDRVDTGVPWYSHRELARAEGMLVNFREWLRVSRSDLTEVGVETDVDALVPAPGDPDGSGAVDDIPVRLRGRIDRLERDEQGRPVVVDVKTGKTAATKADAEQHAQLAAYQLAVALGGLPGERDGVEPGGGRLVYVATSNKTTGAAERIQPALTAELLDEWTGIVRGAARASVGPVFAATPNPGCGHCQLATSCPAKLPGKAVTDD